MGALTTINSNKKIYLGAVSANSVNTTEVPYAVCMSTSTNGIIVYKRSGDIFGKYFTLASDLTISYGAEATIHTSDTDSEMFLVYAPSQNKFLLFYHNVTSQTLSYRPLTVSGTTITAASVISVDNTNACYSVTAVYSPTDTGVHVVFTREVSGTYQISAQCITGTTLTTQSTLRTILASTQAVDTCCTYIDSASRLVISYKTTNQYGVACSYSAGVYTVGTPVQMQASPTSSQNLMYNIRRSTLIFTSRKNNHVCYTPATLSGVTLTAGTTVESSTPTAYYMYSVFDQRSNRILTVAGTGNTSTNSCFLVTHLASGGFGFSKTKLIPYTYTFQAYMSYNNGNIFIFDYDGTSSTLKLRYIKIS